jgi:pyruvate kinase
VQLEQVLADHPTANRVAVDLLVKEGVVQDDDLVIITKGDLMGTGGSTNAMKIVRVGHLADPAAE